jgi:hypothetical protein
MATDRHTFNHHEKKRFGKMPSIEMCGPGDQYHSEIGTSEAVKIRD